jgi:hypothetical protein
MDLSTLTRTLTLMNTGSRSYTRRSKPPLSLPFAGLDFSSHGLTLQSFCHAPHTVSSLRRDSVLVVLMDVQLVCRPTSTHTRTLLGLCCASLAFLFRLIGHQPSIFCLCSDCDADFVSSFVLNVICVPFARLATTINAFFGLGRHSRPTSTKRHKRRSSLDLVLVALSH